MLAVELSHTNGPNHDFIHHSVRPTAHQFELPFRQSNERAPLKPLSSPLHQIVAQRDRKDKVCEGSNTENRDQHPGRSPLISEEVWTLNTNDGNANASCQPSEREDLAEKR